MVTLRQSIFLSFLDIVDIDGVKKLAYGTNYSVLNNALPSIHAEADGLYKLHKINKHKRYINYKDRISLLIIRISKTGVIGMSRPCKNCLIHLCNSNYNITDIYYTNKEGSISYENLSNMIYSPLTKFSTGTLKIHREKKMKKYKK